MLVSGDTNTECPYDIFVFRCDAVMIRLLASDGAYDYDGYRGCDAVFRVDRIDSDCVLHFKPLTQSVADCSISLKAVEFHAGKLMAIEMSGMNGARVSAWSDECESVTTSVDGLVTIVHAPVPIPRDDVTPCVSGGLMFFLMNTVFYRGVDLQSLRDALVTISTDSFDPNARAVFQVFESMVLTVLNVRRERRRRAACLIQSTWLARAYEPRACGFRRAKRDFEQMLSGQAV